MRDELPQYNLLATYPDMDRAREAISALEVHGTEGDDISLLAPDPDADGEPDTEDLTRSRDAGMVRQVGGRTGAGAVLGTATGVLGTAVVLAIPGVGPVVGAGFWAVMAGSGAAGGALGGIFGAESALRNSEVWEQTFETVREGEVLVGVHSEDRSVVERAGGVLEDTEPGRLEWFDDRGKRVEGPQ